MLGTVHNRVRPAIQRPHPLFSAIRLSGINSRLKTAPDVDKYPSANSPAESGMNFQKMTTRYMIAVIVCGLACLAGAIYRAPIHSLDFHFLILFCFTIGVGSRFTIQIPQFKSHIAVSDTFIFLALLMYGGEVAVILSAVEAVFSSWRFCSKRVTIMFNAAAMAITTTCVSFALWLSGLYTIEERHANGEVLQNFIVALSIVAITQFIVNTYLCSLHDSLKNAITLLDVWKNKYAWSFISYFFGAASAGVLKILTELIGFWVIIATFPVIFFIFLAYRMYLKNVEISVQHAEQAEHHAKILEERSDALRESEQRFRSAFNHAPIGIALVAPNGQWLKVNHALCKILGYEADEFLASDYQSMIFAEDLTMTQVRIRSILTGEISNWQMEQRYLHKTGRLVWTSWSVSAAGDAGSEKANLIFQLQDITTRKVVEEKLQHEATHDALTGLANRAYFMTRLTESIQKSRRDSTHRVSVLFIDLDRFKYVNDSLGHIVGDGLLIAISRRLRDCMRPSDTVARLGGDEFTILVEGNYDLAEVTRIAERIQEKFSVPFDISGNVIYSSASIGILHASGKHLTSEDMMRDADTAMYQAKRAGKARHEIFDEKMHAAARETLRLETDLRRAIENHDFTVLYQPIVSLTTGAIVAVEALARWQHPEFGKVSPAKFVPLAEEIGWIDRLGDQILRRACSQMRDIFKNNPFARDAKLSVNLSCREFANEDLVTRIHKVLIDVGFPPERLKLEITESVFFEHHDRAIEMLRKLREIGIETDIDDFGTGYSNFGYLVRLPVSTLKIDRSFVGMMDESSANREVIKTVISLARTLGLKVVAEGIETEEQKDKLYDLGCDLGQGYFFARPMAAEQFEAFVSKIPEHSFQPLEIDDATPIAIVQ